MSRFGRSTTVGTVEVQVRRNQFTVRDDDTGAFSSPTYKKAMTMKILTEHCVDLSDSKRDWPLGEHSESSTAIVGKQTPDGTAPQLDV